MKHSCNIPWALYDLTRLECTGKVKLFAYLIVSLITIFAEGNLLTGNFFHWNSLETFGCFHSEPIFLTPAYYHNPRCINPNQEQFSSSLAGFVPIQFLFHPPHSSSHAVCSPNRSTRSQPASLLVPILLWHSCASPMWWWWWWW